MPTTVRGYRYIQNILIDIRSVVLNLIETIFSRCLY
jgi:hypothetical protein